MAVCRNGSSQLKAYLFFSKRKQPRHIRLLNDPRKFGRDQLKRIITSSRHAIQRLRELCHVLFYNFSQLCIYLVFGYIVLIQPNLIRLININTTVWSHSITLFAIKICTPSTGCGSNEKLPLLLTF